MKSVKPIICTLLAIVLILQIVRLVQLSQRRVKKVISERPKIKEDYASFSNGNEFYCAVVKEDGKYFIIKLKKRRLQAGNVFLFSKYAFSLDESGNLSNPSTVINELGWMGDAPKKDADDFILLEGIDKNSLTGTISGRVSKVEGENRMIYATYISEADKRKYNMRLCTGAGWGADDVFVNFNLFKMKMQTWFFHNFVNGGTVEQQATPRFMETNLVPFGQVTGDLRSGDATFFPQSPDLAQSMYSLKREGNMIEWGAIYKYGTDYGADQRIYYLGFGSTRLNISPIDRTYSQSFYLISSDKNTL